VNDFTLHREELNSPDAVQLIQELNDFVSTLYPPEDNFFELPEVEAFIIARDAHGNALGCGGIKAIDHPHLPMPAVEIKRMYTREAARRRGIARAIVTELENIARTAGFARILLETGHRQPDAIALYVSRGFVEIPLYGEYVTSGTSLCFEKILD
jgi:GNAT superfamily N-acetyltransferase